MEIEFNTGRIPNPGTSQTVVRRNVTPPAQDSVSFSSSNALKSQLGQATASRPEQVARAKELVADRNYPAAADLDKIATILTARPNASSSNAQAS